MAHMRYHGSATNKVARLRLFVASLWLALATAVFCAVVPAGLPHSASHGSAFNPANSVVALHSASSKRAIFKRGEGDPAPAPSAGADVIAPNDSPAIAVPILSARLAPIATPAAFTLSNVPDARFPRGPPLA